MASSLSKNRSRNKQSHQHRLGSTSNSSFVNACGILALLGWTAFVSSPNFNVVLLQIQDELQQQPRVAHEQDIIELPNESFPFQLSKRSIDDRSEEIEGFHRNTSALLPDWRLAVDCSAFDVHCVSIRQSQGLYEDYPFPLTRSHPHDHLFDWEVLEEIPEDWAQHHLLPFQSLEETPPRRIEYIYPPKASEDAYNFCLNSARIVSWQSQLEYLFDSGNVQPENDTNMVAFTISDYNYALDMIHDFFEMNDKVVGFPGSMFMVAIDYETLDLACQYNYPVIAWPSASTNVTSDNGREEQLLKEAVANTKLEVSYALVERGMSIFFYEMDVWFLKSPKSVVQQFTGDVLFSSHQNCPVCVNIGVYAVLANNRTKEYFQTCIELAKISPNTHDQRVMGGVIAIGAMGKGFHYGKYWDPVPYYVPKIRNPVSQGFFSPHEIVADERPYPNQMALAIHPLRSQPLKSPHGKKIVAKEAGAWYGFEGPAGQAGYYRRKGKHRRYLWMDGHILNGFSTVMNWEYEGQESGVYHDTDSLKWTIATLMALARRTGRIFILPRLLQDRGIYFLWSLLDMRSVEELDIDVRETNFPNNPKSWYSPSVPFGSVARTALGNFKKDQTMFAQYAKAQDGHKRVTTTRAWRFATEAMNLTKSMDEESAIDTWWAMHTAIAEIDEAELLLVNPHFINMHYHRPLSKKMRTMGGRRAGDDSSFKGIAEYEIASVYYRLRWCTNRDKPLDRVVGTFKADDDCYGQGVGS